MGSFPGFFPDWSTVLVRCLRREHEGLTVEFVSAKEPVAVVCDGDVDDDFAFRMRLPDCSDESCGTMVRPIVRAVNKKARMRSAYEPPR